MKNALATFDYTYYVELKNVSPDSLCEIIQTVSDEICDDENFEHDYKFEISPYTCEANYDNGAFNVKIWDRFTCNDPDEIDDISRSITEECNRLEEFINSFNILHREK